MSNSVYALNLVAFGQSHLELTPKFPAATPRRGVMFVHGAGSTSLYCIAPTGSQSTVTNTIVDRGGHPGIAQDLGGLETWGNNTAREHMDLTYERQQVVQDVKDEKVFLMFGSMGGITSLNWTALDPSKVAGIIGVIPVINPNDIQLNNWWNYGPSIDAAYDGDYQESIYGSTSNPHTMSLTGIYAGIPMLFFYGLTDDLCRPQFCEEFAARANATGGNVTLIPINDGHTFTTYDTVAQPQNLQLILDFLATYN